MLIHLWFIIPFRIFYVLPKDFSMPAIDKEIFKLVLNQLNHKYSDLESKSKLVEESFYLEHLRLQKKRKKTFAEVKFYKKLQKKYLGDEKQVNATFRAIIKNHLKEIQGNFSFRVFKFVQRILTSGLKFFINEFYKYFKKQFW